MTHTNGYHSAPLVIPSSKLSTSCENQNIKHPKSDVCLVYLSDAPVVYILSKNVWIMVCINLCQEFERRVIHCSRAALFFQIRKRLWSIPGEAGDLGYIQRILLLRHT